MKNGRKRKMQSREKKGNPGGRRKLPTEKKRTERERVKPNEKNSVCFVLSEMNTFVMIKAL